MGKANPCEDFVGQNLEMSPQARDGYQRKEKGKTEGGGGELTAHNILETVRPAYLTDVSARAL